MVTFMNMRFFTDRFARWQASLADILATTSLAEMVAAFTLPLLALLIGIRINRYIDSKPNHTLNAKVIDFLAPLISPVLAILFTLGAIAVLVQMGYDPVILTFVMKLCVAWLAVHGVMTLSSGKTAGLFIAFVILPVTMLHLFGVWDYTVEALNAVDFKVGGIKFNLYTILKAALTIIVMFWTVGFVLSTTENRLRRVRSMRASNRTLIMKFLQIGLYIVVFLFGLNLIGVSLTTLSIFSGALGVGVGLGLQKIASNFISGIILLFEKSIEIGDLVRLEDGTEGFVRQTSARYTLIEQFNGTEALVPNENFINQRVDNQTGTSTRGRAQIFVGVGYDSDLRKVIALMVETAAQHERCANDPAPAAFVIGFGDSAINMQLNFWVDDMENGTLGISSDIMIGIIDRFREHQIVIPYPHQVAVLPSEVGEKVLDGDRIDLLRTKQTRRKSRTDSSGSQQEAKEIRKAAPISKETNK